MAERSFLREELDITDLEPILTALQDNHFTTTKSHQLGLHLGLLEPNLDEVDSNFPASASDRLRECLSRWLKKQDRVEQKGGATLQSFINALMRIGEVSVAQAIEKMRAQTSDGYELISLTAADGQRRVHKSVPLFYPNNMTYDPTTNKLTPNGEQRSSLCICENGMELLANIEKPIAVLSIAGPARTGKSYILSRLLDSHDAFELGHTVNAQTHGIWMGTQALKYKDRVLVLLDTEGIGAVTGDCTNDANILVMTLLMSSYFIYNSKGVPNTDDLNKMRVFTTLAHSIAVTTKESGVKSSVQQQDLLRHYFPSFLWLLRDFMLKLPEDCETGKEMTSKNYLVNNVLRTDGVNAANDQVRMAIVRSFHDINCFLLPLPSCKRDVTCNIAVCHQELEAEFKSGVEKLVSLLRKSVTAKKGFQSSEPINGRTLALLAYKYIEALNSPSSVPCLHDSWFDVAKQRCSEIQDELVKEYRSLMEQKIAEASEGQIPLEVQTDDSSTATIMGTHCLVFSQLQQKLFDKVRPFVMIEEEQERVCAEFEEKLVLYEGDSIKGGVVIEFLRANEERSQTFCMEIWKKQFSPVEVRIRSGDFYTYQQYTEDFDEACNDYLSLARGPAKWAVLKNAREQEKDYINRLQGYDDQTYMRRVVRKTVEETKHMFEDEKREKEVQRDENLLMRLQTFEFMREKMEERFYKWQEDMENRLDKERAKREEMVQAHMTKLEELSHRIYEDMKTEKKEAEARHMQLTEMHNKKETEFIALLEKKHSLLFEKLEEKHHLQMQVLLNETQKIPGIRRNSNNDDDDNKWPDNNKKRPGDDKGKKQPEGKLDNDAKTNDLDDFRREIIDVIANIRVEENKK